MVPAPKEKGKSYVYVVQLLAVSRQQAALGADFDRPSDRHAQEVSSPSSRVPRSWLFFERSNFLPTFFDRMHSDLLWFGRHCYQ
jgi:hypothetical protein